MQHLKNISGLYIVTLNNSEPISVNANDPRRALSSIMVNNANCKFGKAKCLYRRMRNYQKVFGEHNVNFEPIIFMTEIDEAEKLILNELSNFRVKGKTGKPNEWLIGIQEQMIIQIVHSTLKMHSFNFESNILSFKSYKETA